MADAGSAEQARRQLAEPGREHDVTQEGPRASCGLSEVYQLRPAVPGMSPGIHLLLFRCLVGCVPAGGREHQAVPQLSR